jgi:hypothetical protein
MEDSTVHAMLDSLEPTVQKTTMSVRMCIIVIPMQIVAMSMEATPVLVRMVGLVMDSRVQI